MLREDVAALDRIQADLDEYRKDMLQDVALHMERVDNVRLHPCHPFSSLQVLLRLNERASEFLSEKIAITNILELLKDEKFKRAFQDEVVADTGLELERAVQEMVDWILKRNAKQWNTIFETLQIRAQLNSAKMVGTVKTQFEYNRDSLITDLGSTAEKVISLFDRKREAQALNDTVKSSIYQTAIIEVPPLPLLLLILLTLPGRCPGPRWPHLCLSLRRDRHPARLCSSRHGPRHSSIHAPEAEARLPPQARRPAPEDVGVTADAVHQAPRRRHRQDQREHSPLLALCSHGAGQRGQDDEGAADDRQRSALARRLY